MAWNPDIVDIHIDTCFQSPKWDIEFFASILQVPDLIPRHGKEVGWINFKGLNGFVYCRFKFRLNP